jgi:hypothetical protein
MSMYGKCRGVCRINPRANPSAGMTTGKAIKKFVSALCSVLISHGLLVQAGRFEMGSKLLLSNGRRGAKQPRCRLLRIRVYETIIEGSFLDPRELSVMKTYETSATVEDQGQVRVGGVPFAPGTEVDVTISPKRRSVDEFNAAWRRVCAELRSRPALQNVTEEDIRDEIDRRRARQ